MARAFAQALRPLLRPLSSAAGRRATLLGSPSGSSCSWRTLYTVGTFHCRSPLPSARAFSPPGCDIDGTSCQLRSISTTAARLARAKPARSRPSEPSAESGSLEPSSWGSAAPEREKRDESIEARLNRSQLSTLRDVETQRHVAKVFSTTTATIGACGATSAMALATGLSVPPLIGLAGLVPLVGFYMFTDVNTNPVIRGGLLVTFTATAGLSLTPLLGAATMIDPMIIPMALGGTTAIMAGSAGAALLAPRASMLKFAPVLGGGVMVLLGASFLGLYQSYAYGAVSPWLYSIHLYGGLGLATLFTAYDTQNIVEEFRAGSRDYMRHSVDMFINFLMIFKRMLLLFMSRD